MPTEIPEPATLLRREATAKALTAAGFPISEKTLAGMAVRGGGPAYQMFGRVVLYRWRDVSAWAENRLRARAQGADAA